MSNKTHLRKQSLFDQEWHLGLDVPTIETAHAEGERENKPAKQQQDKAWATKPQQDWPINMVINSWLLACKASWDKLYLYAKPALRVDPYF
jgi:hypothetical protein